MAGASPPAGNRPGQQEEVMRNSVLIAGLLLLLSSVAFCADKPQTPEELRAIADKASGESCTKVCLEAARALVEQANQLFTEGSIEQAQASMKDAVGYARKAADASVQSRKKQKQTEIALRKLEKRVIDIMETLNFEDKAPVKEAADQIDKSRASILTAMFDLDNPRIGKDKL
jgi:hypothetical protein